MKKIIITIIILGIVYLVSYLYFRGFPVGYKNNHFVVYTHACADLCPAQGSWYKKYYGEISYDQCLEIGGSPKFVGMVVRLPDGRPGNSGLGGYDGCKAD